MVKTAQGDQALVDMERVNGLIQEVFRKGEYKRMRESDSADIIKCATPIIRKALKNPDLLWPENRFILYRPTDPWDQDYYGNVDVWTYDSPGGHFRLHYTEQKDTNPLTNPSNEDHRPDGWDGNPDTIPWYISTLASYFDHVRTTEINGMGYLAPRSDGTMGGNSLFDVYVLDIGAYGYTAIESGRAYIVIDEDLNFGTNYDPNGVQRGNMKVTAAHEFFHAIQYEYDDWYDNPSTWLIENIWWEENTAVWMEDEVYDYVDDYLRYLPDKLDALDESIDSDSKVSQYGGVLWAKFLAETFGNNMIRHIFERCLEIYPPLAKQAMEDTLYSYNSNWGEAMSQYCLKNLTMDYEEGDKYLWEYGGADYFTDIIHDQYYDYTSANATRGIEHLSVHYILLEEGYLSDNPILTLNHEGGERPLIILVADKSASGDPSWELIKNDIHVWPYIDMAYTLNGFGTTYPRAYLIVINPDPDNYSEYSWSEDTNALALQTPVIHSPVSGQTLIFDYGSAPFTVSLSVENIPADPNDPNRIVNYSFELYKNPDFVLLDSNTVTEDPNGITSYQTQVSEEGSFYYWRCQAKTSDPIATGSWTPLSGFYPLTIQTEDIQEELWSDPNFIIIRVSDANSPIYGTAVKLRASEDPNQITIAQVTNPPVNTGKITPVGNWVYFGPDGFSFSETATISFIYTQQQMKDANIADPNGVIDPNHLGVYQYQIKDPYLSASLVEIESQHDPNTKIIEGDVQHFSLYVVGFSMQSDSDPNDDSNPGGGTLFFKTSGGCFISALPQNSFF